MMHEREKRRDEHPRATCSFKHSIYMDQSMSSMQLPMRRKTRDENLRRGMSLFLVFQNLIRIFDAFKSRCLRVAR